MPIPKEALELVERFERNRIEYMSGKYNETQLRREFIDPLFAVLGWDVSNKEGYGEAYKDVIHEDAIKIGGTTKAPDYCFRLGGARKFFLEAKKPSINLKDGISSAFQLRRYAWSAKLSLSILTDFEEFAVYDCRIKPDKNDKASTARILYLNSSEYVERWDDIASIFSREAVLKGSFDHYAETTRSRRGSAEVDASFLKEIESWRVSLARNLALRNPWLSQRDLNFAVQRTIDRIIFLRICEDRGIEPYGRLMNLTKDFGIYSGLVALFQSADERYNSGLFHFQKEKGRTEEPDELTRNLIFDDKPLKEIIKSLYYPDSPYEFSVLPADILGQVYEQFLGKVIRLTAGHRAVVEDKPEVKKAGGVYYTPTYIVDYIVKQTVGKLCEGKKPATVARLRVLDPSCGSGSFLIGAYQYLLDWHINWYIEDGVEKHKRELYRGVTGDWRLSTTERKRILLNNIYGVDIDFQAVEVTKLSLLLKVLEGESTQTLDSQLRLFHERALPDLGSNIKWGNSLISSDFYDDTQITFFNEEERYRINVFDWEVEFPNIKKNQAFDVVIGNPPWGAEFSESELAYLRKNFNRVISRMIDSYIYFIDRSEQLNKKGYIGLIIPSTILNQVDAKPVRELLLNRGLSVLINLGRNIFGAKVLNTSTILISSNRRDQDNFILENLSELPLEERKIGLVKARSTKWGEWKDLVLRDAHFTFFAGEVNATLLLDRLRQGHVLFSEILEGHIQRGVSPDVASAHVISKVEADAAALEDALLRPSVSGSQIKRYRKWTVDQYIIYTTRFTQLHRFPNIRNHLDQYKHLNTCKEVLQGKHPWYALHRPRDPQIFVSPKFIGLTTSKTIELIYDKDDSLYVTDAMYVFTVGSNYDPLATMAVLQSKLFLFLYRVANQGESRVIPQVKASKLETIPFPSTDSDHPTFSKLSRLSEGMIFLNNRLTAVKTGQDKTAIQRQIDATSRQIDQLVYELYGLTQNEITMVESVLS